MSRSIDERVVEMNFDNSKFESGAKQTMSTLEKLKQSLKLEGAAKGFEEVSTAAGNIKMDGISAACETVSAKFSALQVVAVTALANIANDAINTGKKLLSALTIDGARDGFGEYELKMGSVQTIMAGTGESLETVMSRLEELNKYADQTIYSFSDMTANIGKFTNAGVKLDDAVAAIKGISNEAAVSGANTQEASRAMYNFAQALSAGYVKLIDWKSIENANMATVEFKNELIETAVALGTVVKEGELYRSTTTNAKGQTSELFDATHAFNDALNAQWMTTEVLTKTLAKYADETTDIGAKATAAATEVKTFTMMMDTLKEAVGSGWAVTFENIVGDFNQAKKTFTAATDVLSEVIENQADARNKFVKDAFGTSGVSNIKDWSKLKIAIEGTGSSVDQFQELLKQTARENGIAVDDMIKDAGSFTKSLERGWLSAEIFTGTVDKINELSDKTPQFKALAEVIGDTNVGFSKLSEEFGELSGRSHVINAVSNSFKALQEIIKPIKGAFEEVFPPKTGEDLRKLLKTLDEFSKKLIISEDAAAKVKETFTGFFKVIKMGLDGVKAIGQAFSPLVDIFKILFTNLLQGVGSLGKFFNTLDDGRESTSLFQTALTTIHDVLESFANNLQGYIDKIKNGFNILKDTISQSWDTGVLSIVAEAIERIKEAIERLITGTGGGLKTFFESLNGNGEKTFTIVNVLTAFADGLKKVWEKLQPILQPIINGLKEFFTGFDLIDTLTAGVEAGGIGVIVSKIYGFVDNIGDLSTQLENIKNAPGIISGFIQQLGDTFESLEQQIRVSIVKDFAVSVGILAAAIFALGTIDAGKAWNAVAIISVLVGELAFIFDRISKIKFDSVGKTGFFGQIQNYFAQVQTLANITVLSTTLIKIASSVLILAVAMKTLSNIDAPALWQSLGVVTILLGELTGVMLALSKFSGEEVAQGSGALIGLSVALTILAGAMKIIASISGEDTVKGVLVVTSLISELLIAMMLMDGVKAHTGAFIAASVALLILAGAMKVYATMNLGEIVKGLVAIGGLLIELAIGLNFMVSALPGAAALLVAAPALLILAGAMKVLGGLKLTEIIKGLIAVAGLLAELAIGLNFMMFALPGAAALLVAATALAVLTPALIALSKVPAKDIYKALGELAVALVSFGLVGSVLGIVSPLLLAFSAALLVFGVAIVSIGTGIAIAAAGLTALSAAFGILSEIGKESAERVVETLQIILIGIMELAPKMGEALVAGLESMAKRFIEAAPTLMSALTVLVGMLIDVFTKKIPALATAFWTMLTALQDKATEFLPHIVDTFLEMIELILQAFNDHLPDLIQSGIDIMVSLIKGIQETQNQLINAAIEAIIAFINGLADSIDKYTPQLIAAVNRLFNSIINAMLLILFNGNPKLVEKAKELMGSFKSGITSKISEVVGTIAELVSKMVAKVKERVADFVEAGRNMIAGFINGVKEKFSDAVDTVKEFGGNALNALTTKLKEHSPSKATYQIGAFFDDGFINAVKDGTKGAEKATTNLGEKAMDSLVHALDNDLDLTPTITPVLDLTNIEKGASDISKLSNGWDDISIGTSSNMASKIANGFNIASANKAMENQNGIDLLRSAINAMKDADSGMTQNNTFNISGDDPRAIADEVSKVLQMQVERRGAVWA